ncbi:adenosylcobinamide-phosphate synthase [Austwickia chelonae]|uniref:Cobalamin biosynthesis protein CobD n=1 Tax=Austwickia chelonae NBRC 105200 TaxID=1184607 RepID=K6W5J1_9MICO|nr:cobalamin biosynthesis protein [Austwickia chelonae]GAB77087.1 cobalamin biosynthesis protein CobD [Austwickia chelonae NBRC 105200]SEW33890.1 adenosylcobinamide-phosphate synthase [Austwickia chelonae]
MASPHATRAAGLALGLLIDAALGDPRRGHPVALFGSWAARLEQATYRDSRTAGTIHLAAATLPVLAIGLTAERTSRRHPIAHILTTAAATWAVVGARTLAHEGETLADALAADDLDAARQRLPHLCGREPSGLDEHELARATIESLAENTSDAVTCPLMWGACLGIPGLLVHRAVNTLDAMVGHRNPRYARFGTASARLDDLMALLPARATGLLACAVAPLAGGDRTAAWTTMVRDHAAHPSPNGGWCESAWAGALHIQLGGRNVYHSKVEERPLLGDGRRPGGTDIHRAARLVRAVTTAGTATAVAALGIAALTQEKSS